MSHRSSKHSAILASGLLLCAAILSFSGSGTAGTQNSNAQYLADASQLFWFIHTSDTHIGARGTKDSGNLRWLITTAKDAISPSFIIVTGDLTDSTNGNILGYPNGPYQAEWTEYKSIVDPYVNATNYFDVPGNHDAYNDKTFSYYRNNSVQGRASGGISTQVSFIQMLGKNKYHFLGINTAGNDGAPFSLSPPYGDHAGLDPAEITFITDALQTNADAQLTLVFGHHPLFDTGSSDDTWVSEGLNSFLGLMDKYFGLLYGFGHTHDASEAFFVPSSAAYPGFYYFNVASLGKSTANQYTIMAIDGNGLSSKIATIGSWPAVLITAPLDATTNNTNPYAYAVPASDSNPIRALVFDPTSVSSVQFQVDQQTPVPMSLLKANVYQGFWNASGLAAGSTHTIRVDARNASNVAASNTITVKVAGSAPTLKTQATIQTQAATYYRGDTILFQTKVTDSNGTALQAATVNVSISGPSTKLLTLGPTDSLGLATATWTTTAPNRKKQGGTPTGIYTATITGVSSTYPWNGIGSKTTFEIR